MKTFIALLLLINLTELSANTTNLVCRMKTPQTEHVTKVNIDTENKKIKYQTSSSLLNFEIISISKTHIQGIWYREDSHVLVIVIDKIDKNLQMIRSDTEIRISKYKCGIDM